jgi:hypothetical protein
MHLSKVTVDILKNLATINQGMIFRPGKVLTTMHVLKHTFVTAEIPDEIPIEFAIYDLNEFLGTFSLSDNCDITFEEKRMVLTTASEYTHYNFSNPSVVVSPGDRKMTMPSEDVKFTLTKEVFDKIGRVSGVMKLKDILIDCTGITVFNRNSTGNQHHITIPVDCGKTNKPAILKVDSLKLIPVDYTVTISNVGLSRFVSNSEEYRIEYFIALETE